MLDLGRRVLVGHLQGDVGLVVLQARPAAVVADQRRGQVDVDRLVRALAFRRGLLGRGERREQTQAQGQR